MRKNIDAEKLIAEIERLSKRYRDTIFDNVAKAALEKVCSIIASLQQEQPEVDLEKEIKFFLTNAIKMNKGQWRGEYHIGEIGIRAIAHRFYELGLNARKEE